MTIYEHGCAGQKARIHAHAIAGFDLDGYKAFPVTAFAVHIGTQLAKETTLELVDFKHIHAHDKRLSGGYAALNHEYVFELIFAGRWNAGSLIDLRRIEQIQYGQVLHAQHPVHSFQAETAFPVQEIRNVSLPEASLGGEFQSGEFAFLNPFPKRLAKIFLQTFEFHAGKYTTVSIAYCYYSCAVNSL